MTRPRAKYQIPRGLKSAHSRQIHIPTFGRPNFRGTFKKLHAARCEAPTTTTTTALRRGGARQAAGNIADCEGDRRSDHHVPGPGDLGAEPDIEFDGEAASHAYHGAALVGAPGEQAEQEDSQHGAISDGGDRKPDLDHAPAVLGENGQAEQYQSPHERGGAGDREAPAFRSLRAAAQVKIHEELEETEFRAALRLDMAAA